MALIHIQQISENINPKNKLWANYQTLISQKNTEISIPIPSMYGIFTYIYSIFMVNVGKYTISRGSSGIEPRSRKLSLACEDPILLVRDSFKRYIEVWRCFSKNNTPLDPKNPWKMQVFWTPNIWVITYITL